ncbi:nucleolar protein 12 (25kDa) domain-containing protein [Hirsutella rhossiliensis]|uniref:Nucleolar protein 12 (25kDa) domain-containing protein n=1 Tax=Hirsutella rhossiliensis TaxID=111463 RepID=A0A9P8N1G2_9HYPO|nr:nucleolar protein 12 (25kDa) domain-containing protein [Hirsutella rhossiliensis]KAH0964852.1 nucleolar protein 12 (25kDa) domain-containing protein [Hirsutella rhossiliensis]
MFAKPRPKKSILPPPSKKRKTTSSVQEITFDDGARQEYLTGFHKRKLERVKHAQEQAAKQARQEKLDARKQLRDERRREVEEHVQTVNRLLRESGAVVDPVEAEPNDGDEDEWGGFPDKPDLDIIDHEEEYVDEDRYTTVTVETVSVSREGLSKPQTEANEADDVETAHPSSGDQEFREKEARPAKIKKKKFRYESKIERQLTNSRQRAKSQRQK